LLVKTPEYPHSGLVDASAERGPLFSLACSPPRQDSRSIRLRQTPAGPSGLAIAASPHLPDRVHRHSPFAAQAACPSPPPDLNTTAFPMRVRDPSRRVV